MGVDVHLDEIKRLTPRYNVCVTFFFWFVLDEMNKAAASHLILSETARCQWIHLRHWSKWISAAPSKTSAKGNLYVCLINYVFYLYCGLRLSIGWYSLFLLFTSQLVNLPEPVTLDFLDAEVEDSNKEEVSSKKEISGFRQFLYYG